MLPGHRGDARARLTAPLFWPSFYRHLTLAMMPGKPQLLSMPAGDIDTHKQEFSLGVPLTACLLLSLFLALLLPFFVKKYTHLFDFSAFVD
jgi:hypothetical protein